MPFRLRSTRARICLRDRKSTRLNSSHLGISYAVFCLKKKKPRCCRSRPAVARKISAIARRRHATIPASPRRIFCFFLNDTATTEIYTLSLHDALPILLRSVPVLANVLEVQPYTKLQTLFDADRKSTRLNSSHLGISYAVFCLKKK